MLVRKSKIVQDAEGLFTLAEAEKRFGISALELHRYAAAGEIELCALVPDGCRVYNVDPATLQIDNPAYLLPLSRFVNTDPTPFDLPPTPARVPLQAVIVSRLTCIITLPVESMPRMSVVQNLFSAGFSNTPTGQSSYLRLLPQWPGYESGARAFNPEQWCFAVYPEGQAFTRTVTTWTSSGFQPPVDLNVYHEVLLVPESEVQKALALRALPAAEAPTLEASSQDEPEMMSPESESPAPELLPVQPVIVAASKTPPVAEASVQPPRKFLRIEEVGARIGVKRSTIYTRMDPDSKYFDPTFPKQTRLWGGKGPAVWDAAELDAWMALQLEQRSNG